MAPRWLSSFFEKDNVLRTRRETRCLGQSGTPIGCGLGVVIEAFKVVGLPTFFADMVKRLGSGSVTRRGASAPVRVEDSVVGSPVVHEGVRIKVTIG